MGRRSYIARPATRALNPTGGFLKGFTYSLNPYIGCAFGAGGGCPFCYVRQLAVAHAQPGAWGSWVIAKSNLAGLLRAELAALAARDRLASATVFMSSATDPYQGLERRYQLSRRALEAFIRYPIRRLLLQTRSPLIERDVDLLERLGRRVVVSITVETDDDEVRCTLSPTSPSVGRRLETARLMRARGIFVQLAIAPMMPNHPDRFATLAAEAADRVVIDTYFAGDGSGGRRSLRLGIGELYQRYGYERWFQPGAEAPLISAMRSRFGPRRVLFSNKGFASL